MAISLKTEEKIYRVDLRSLMDYLQLHQKGVQRKGLKSVVSDL